MRTQKLPSDTPSDRLARRSAFDEGGSDQSATSDQSELQPATSNLRIPINFNVTGTLR